MGCTTVKLNDYPNLEKVLINRLGNDTAAMANYVAAINSKEFKTLVAENNMNINKTPAQAFELLKEVVIKRTKSLDEINKHIVEKNQGLFLSARARNEALEYIARLARSYVSDAIFKGNKKPTFKENLYDIRNKKILAQVCISLKSFHPNKANDINDYFKNKDIEQITELVRQANNNQLTNLFAAFLSLGDPVFVHDILNRRSVAGIYEESDVSEVFAESEEDGTFELDGVLDEEVDDTDYGAIAWMNNIGEKSDFKKHVEELIKLQLETIPVLNSIQPVGQNKKTGNLIWNRNTDNELGVTNYMDSGTIMNLLYTETDKTEVNSFVNSIYDIAASYPGMEGLAYLYNNLRNNPDLAMKYKMVFSMPVIKKQAVFIDDKKTELRVVNNNVDAIAIIRNNLTYNIKNVTKKQLDILNKFTKNDINLFDKVFEVIHEVYPDIKKKEFLLYYNNNAGDNYSSIYNFIVGTRSIAEKVIENKATYVELLKNKKSTEGFTFVPNSAKNIFDAFAIGYKRFANINISLNGQNVLGKQASYVINNSYLTNFNQVLRSKEAVRAYAAQKFRGTDYNYDNVLFETTSSTGELMPGLFRKVNDSYVLTEYATELVEVTLFDGSANTDIEKANVYKDLSDGDYLLTSLIAYNTKKSVTVTRNNVEHKINVSNFFLNIPSDAPKNFLVSMPSYELDGLYTRENVDVVYNQATDKYSAINVVDKKTFDTSKLPIIAHEYIQSLINKEDNINIPINSNAFIQTKDGFRYFIKDVFGNDYEITATGIREIDGKYYATNAKMKSRLVAGEINQDAFNKGLEVYKALELAKANKEGITYLSMNHNHPLAISLKNIIKQEILDAYSESRRVFQVDSSDDVLIDRIEDSETYTQPMLKTDFDINKVYGAYGKGKKGIFTMKNGKAELLGNVYKLYELATDNATLNKYYNLLGNDKVFDLLYGRGENKVKVVNGELILSATQEAAINEAIEEFVLSYGRNAPAYLKKEYGSFIKDYDNKTIIEFLLNRMIASVSMGALFNGKTKYYKNMQAVLKRAKQVQAGGRNLGNINLASNSFNSMDIYANKAISINKNGNPVILKDRRGNPIMFHSTFTGVTVENTSKFSSDETLKRMDDMFSKTNVTDEVRERILKPFGYFKNNKDNDAEPTITNDAQSYITLEEWIRRTAAAGELSKYADLIEALLDESIPNEAIDWTKFKNKVQIQKNFYYDLHRESLDSPEVPRQIKNAEFVLIPRFIKGTNLEKVYDAMVAHDIDQLNTAETSKAAEHNIIEMWDKNTGKLKVEEFEAKVDAAKQTYDYKYLYRQQDVPEHMVDTRNKAGIQILKKMLDNLPNTGKTKLLKQKFFDYYTSNIKQSFLDLAAEFNLSIDNNGNLKIDENGNLDNFNIKVFLQKAKEQAVSQNANRVIIEMFDEVMEDFNRYPLFANNIGTKAENIINSLFNKNITRQTIEGWHAAQLSDFGFEKLIDNNDKVETDGKLAYKQLGEIDGVPVYYMEIRLRRWSNMLYEEIKNEKGEVINRIPIPIDEVSDSAKTMIGYRIPTEGKQSITIMKVVEFLDDAYGSTVVVPDEWVTQTGSDFDVDSVYAMTKHLRRLKDGTITDIKESDYTKDEAGYLKYINNNIDRAARKKLGEYTEIKNTTIEEIKNNRKILQEQFDENYKATVAEKITELFAAKNDLYTKGKTDKEVREILKTIGKKEKDTKIKPYIETAINNLRLLQVNGTIVNQTELLNETIQQYIELYDKFINQKKEREKIYEDSKGLIREAIETSARQQFEQAEKFAEDNGLMDYVTWINNFDDNKPDCLDNKTRNNVIVQTFIDILTDSSSFEENTGRSHFETLGTNNNKWAEIHSKYVNKVANTITEKSIPGANDFITQMKWKEAAGSGIKIKAISVYLDTMASIGNITHAVIANPIIVRYDNINTDNAEKSYKNDYDKENGIVKHRMLGWSHNNKNIDNELLTPYSSQTTSHILDVMKVGAVHNENVYTFAAFKLLLNIGINYDTAIGFMHQPAIDLLVNNWKLTQSFNDNDNSNIIFKTFEELANKLRIDTNHDNKDSIIGKFYKKYGKVVIEKYGDFNNPYIYSKYNEDRLTGEMTEEEAAIHDFVTMMQFDNINKQANVVNNYLRVLTSDKFGAKQTFFQTDRILRDINDLLKDSDEKYRYDEQLYVEQNGTNINILDAVYPGIRKSAKYIDVKKSAYPSLAAMLKYATFTSTVVDANVFETNQKNFNNIVNSLGEFTATGKLREEEASAYKQHLIHRAYIGANSSPFVTMPVSIANDGSLIIHTSSTGEQKQTVKNIEMLRVAGLSFTPEAENTFAVKDILNPTREELDTYSKLTPAQKILWLKRNYNYDLGIFDYIEVNNFNESSIRKMGYATKTITVRRGDMSDNGLYDLFDKMYLSNNPIIRLAAIDLVKYAYIVEGNKFKHNTLSRIVSNIPLRDTAFGGMGIGLSAKTAIQDYLNIAPDGIAAKELAVGFIRSNYDTFRAPNADLDRASKENDIIASHIKANPQGVIRIDLSEKDNLNVFVKYRFLTPNKNYYPILRIKRGNTRLLYYAIEDGLGLAYYPINKLSNFDADKTIENSIYNLNNTFTSLENAIYSRKNTNLINNYTLFNTEFNIDNNAVKQDIGVDKFKLTMTLNNNDWYSNNAIVYPNAKLNNDVVELHDTIHGKNYIAIKVTEQAKKFINETYNKAYTDYKNKLKKYPNYDTSNDYIIIPKIITSPNTRFSTLEDKDAISNAIKQAMVKIKNESKAGDASAAGAVKSIHVANIDMLDKNSIASNEPVALSVTARYIKAAADNFINQTEAFLTDGSVRIPVNDDRVIKEALDKPEVNAKFLTLANSMAAFKERYKLFTNIDTEGLNPDTKEAIETIQKAITDISNNTKIVQARRKYLNEYIKRNSSNPNVAEDLQTAFDIYGDTNKPDYWLQDIKFNRNPIIQAVYADTANVIQQARIEGKQEAVAFEKEFNRIKAEAAKNGKTINFDRFIDENGKFIQPQSKAWYDKRDELKRKYIQAVKDTGDVNSIEALKANMIYRHFIVSTTIPKYKDVIGIAADGVSTIKLNYDYALLQEERKMFNTNNPLIAKYYSEYKKLLSQQRDILSNMVGGVLNEEQELKMNEIYKKLNHLTSIYDDSFIEKDPAEYEAANALKRYIQQTKAIKNLYFDKQAKDGFKVQLERNLDIIKKLELRDETGRLITPLSVLMTNIDYKKARQWLRYNAIFTPDKTIQDELSSAYEVLRDEKKYDSPVNLKIKDANARDEFGIVDGTKFSEEDVKFIKNQVLLNYRISKSSGNPYGGIIRSNVEHDVVYNYSFYNSLTGSMKPDEAILFGEAINSILSKAYDNGNKVLHAASDKLTIEDLKKIKAFKEQYENAIEGTGRKEVAEFIENECVVTYNRKAYTDDLRELATKTDEYKELWRSIFEEVDYDGNIVPSRMFYGLIEPKDKNKWIDKNRTHALKIIQTHTQNTKTQYYYDTYNKLRNELSAEEFRKWYNDNHYFNPYSRSFEPSPIWTHTEYFYENGEKAEGIWEPRVNQTDSIVKEELINKEYNPDKNNYKLGSKYLNESMDNQDYLNINEYEQQVINLFQKYIEKYAFNGNNKSFVKQGYLPSIKKEKEFDTTEILKEAAAFLGFSADVPYDLTWKSDDELTYSNDTELPNPMLQIILDKNATPRREVPMMPRADESQADFLVRKQEAIDYNKKVKEENDKLRGQIISKDWIEVMKVFIENSSRLNASRTIKDMLYFADNALNNTDAYELNFANELIVNKATSGEEDVEYRKTSNTYSSLALRNHIRRVVFNQYKETGRPLFMKLGNIAQNVAGTKYMMLNVTGGIANVLTGQANIGMERLAREHFNEKDYLVGQNLYMAGITSYMKNMYNDKADNLQDAIIKLADVVDYDRLAELTGKNIKGNIKKLRSLLFSPQAMGEHYMQNTVLLTMMKNHKVITDGNNNPKIVSRNMYIRTADKDALFEVINDELKKQYNDFVKTIRGDESKKAQYNMFRRNIVEDFVRNYLTLDQQKQYIAKRNKLVDERKKEFNKLPYDVYSQFQLIDGYAELKPDAIITNKEFAAFVEKVKGVNKQIHGVYDKIGAAAIENKWWGGMVMQFHKHLYPGFKKRYRNKYYYDEQLEAVQGASYTSLIRFLSIPFDKMDMNEEKRNVLQSIQVYTKNLCDFIAHVNVNYALLPESERANIRRNLAEMIYVGAAIVAAIALTAAAGGDDEVEESVSYNLALYAADRLASEAFAFNPLGLTSEAKKLWSSPVAFFQSPNDVLKALNFSIRMLMDGSFEEEYMTGRYAGENKLKVILERNIPVWRNINRLQTLPENNSFYKLGENALSIIPVRGVAHWINPNVDVD